MKKKAIIKRLTFIILVLFLLILILLVMLNKTIRIDNYVYNLLIRLKSNNIITIFKIITSFGGATIIIILTILSYFLFKNKIYPRLITINLLLSTLLNLLLKNIFQRERPDVLSIIDESGFSFPSGHASVSFAFYGFFIYLIYKSNLNKKLKIILSSILFILIVLVGISRIFLGVHYFTDILAGFITSSIYLLIYIHFIKKYIV